MIKLYLPKNIKFISIVNNYIYLYNLNLFYLFNTINFFIHYNFSLNILILKKTYKLKHINKTKTIFNNFFFKWDNFFFFKIFFLGKGFKFKKYNKAVIFNFNQSHLNLLKLNSIIIKKIQKTKLLLFSKNYLMLQTLIKKSILTTKPLNVYTNRGLRLAKTHISKKKSKSAS